MKISLSTLMKIIVRAFPVDAISINPTGPKTKNNISIEIEYGRNMGSILYDIENDVAFCPTMNFCQVIEAAVGEAKARQLRENLKKQEAEDWGDEVYQEEKGGTDSDYLAISAAESEGMSACYPKNLM